MILAGRNCCPALQVVWAALDGAQRGCSAPEGQQQRREPRSASAIQPRADLIVLVQYSLVLIRVMMLKVALPCRLQRASATIDHLEAALHQKDELLTQMQGARAARQNALRQEVNHLEEQIPVLQRQLDLAKWRSRDTELPTRRLYTARNSRVEALLELQAM